MTLLIVLLGSSEAWACSCGWPETTVFPADGTAGVATDVMPLLTGGWLAEPVLRDAATGEEVPTATVEQAPPGPMAITRLVPSAPLAPNHSYVIEDGEALGTFTTGDGPDGLPPSAVELPSAETYADDEPCGPHVTVLPQVSAATDDGDVFYVVEVATREDFGDASAVSWTVPEELWLGWSFCGINVPWLAEGDRVFLRGRAEDLSGNQGPWSEPFQVEIGGLPRATAPEVVTERAGCSSTGPGTPSLALLALLALGCRRAATRWLLG